MASPLLTILTVQRQFISTHNTQLLNKLLIPSQISTFKCSSKCSSKCSLRLYSTDNQVTNETPLRKRWNYIKGVVQSFVKGMRLLIADVKQVRVLRHKMGGLKIDGTPPPINSEITWEDIRFIAKTKSDLTRTFPTLVLFCIPLLGYIAPFLALAFPGHLLSSHFWSEEQRKAFDSKNKEFRTKNVKLLKQHLSLSKNDSEISSSLKECFDEIQKMSLKEESLNKLTESRITEINLTSLPSQHLKLLSNSWGIKSTFLPVSWWLRRKLTAHLNYIYCCDHLLLSASPSSDNDKIKEVLHERNIEIDSDLETTLKLWLSVTTRKPKCPHVLLAHLPLVWAQNKD